MSITLNDNAIVMQLARGTEALSLATKLEVIVTLASEERAKAGQRFQLESHQINDRYLGMVLEAWREFNARISTLEVEDDDTNYDDD